MYIIGLPCISYINKSNNTFCKKHQYTAHLLHINQNTKQINYKSCSSILTELQHFYKHTLIWKNLMYLVVHWTISNSLLLNLFKHKQRTLIGDYISPLYDSRVLTHLPSRWRPKFNTPNREGTVYLVWKASSHQRWRLYPSRLRDHTKCQSHLNLGFERPSEVDKRHQAMLGWYVSKHQYNNWYILHTYLSLPMPWI